MVLLKYSSAYYNNEADSTMEKVTKRPKNVLDKMIKDKKKIVAYLQSGDESKRPADIKFVKPFTV